LDAQARRLEGLHLALRTRAGVPSSAFDAADVELLEGLVDQVDGRFVLTRSGRLLANEVSLRVR
jgi:hypothetical protein